MVAFAIGAVLMILAGTVEIFLGVKAERKGLEETASPLTAEGPPVPWAPPPANRDPAPVTVPGLTGPGAGSRRGQPEAFHSLVSPAASAPPAPFVITLVLLERHQC